MSTMTASAPARELPTRWKRFRRSLRANPSMLPTLAAVALFVAMLIYGELAYGRILQLNTMSNLLINNAHLAIIAALAMMFLGRGLASMLSTEPQRLDNDSPIRALGTPIKVIDGPKVNDL